jgi:hypothetical protein
MNDLKKDLERATKTRLTQTEHQRLEIEPKIAGKSLLHDEFGMQKSSGGQKRDFPVLKEITNDPVLVKANKPSGKIVYNRTETPQDDDKFVPPRSNFVSVGNVEHSWYGETPKTVDNNEVVDVEKLQGLKPLAEANDSKTAEAIEYFTKRLQHVKGLVVSELGEITELEELNNLRENTFGKKGVFTDVVRKLDTLEVNKAVVGEFISQVYSELDLEIQGKEYEITSAAEEDEEVTEWPEDIAQSPLSENEPEEFEEKEDTAIPEGHFAIVVDDKLVNVVEDIKSARDIISNLLLNENLDLERIQLMKRIKIDFGVILEN